MPNTNEMLFKLEGPTYTKVVTLSVSHSSKDRLYIQNQSVFGEMFIIQLEVKKRAEAKSYDSSGT